MSSEKNPNLRLENFNLETMSGVSPGIHSRIFQRVRLIPIGKEISGHLWGKLYWHDDCDTVTFFFEPSRKDNIHGRRTEEHSNQFIENKQTANNEHRLEDGPLFQMEIPRDGERTRRLQTKFKEEGWRLQSCGTCRFWQPIETTNSDGVPLGQCSWQMDEIGPMAETSELSRQSSLALPCIHWRYAEIPRKELSQSSQDEVMSLPQADEQKSASSSFWGSWIDRVWSSKNQSAKPQTFAKKIIERSGVGAGTEACFACQGRIANLAALVVETDEGDKQTFSVWRCRTCHTYYLNNWIDRWERLDTLETEERYYRIAPIEAYWQISMIEEVPGGDHPNGRNQRMEYRDWFEQFCSERELLSHQIKHGR